MLGMHARYSYAGFVIENLLKYMRPAQIILKQDQYHYCLKSYNDTVIENFTIIRLIKLHGN